MNITTCLSRSDSLGELSSLYTYPLLIEFSILVMCVYGGIYDRCDTVQLGKPDVDMHVQPIYHNTYEGLVIGWFSIVTAVLFILMYMYESHRTTSGESRFVAPVYGLNFTFVLVCLLCAIAVIYQMSGMKSIPNLRLTKKERREYCLLALTCSCMALYKLLCVIAGIHFWTYLLITDGISSILSGLMQTSLVIIYAPRRRLSGPSQRPLKPGRQCLEVLRCTNLALWLVSTFLVKDHLASGPLVHKFGSLAWPVMANILQPMTILFYFHSTMCVSHIIATCHKCHGKPRVKRKRHAVNGVDNAAFTITTCTRL